MFPNVNPKHLEQAMKKLGVKQEILDASEVIIKCATKNLLITNPQVIKVNMMGQETFQITGTIQEAPSFSQEDIATVATQAHVNQEEAAVALEATNGDLAEAILKLQHPQHV
ncbi:MAG TPA: nascent polypeptide-associated complex protein [Candidatus Nanoarchaeia archaeon]|nr:nascent polypeptide-associated complex protein [Candidatus Nanoarchaeia archaeon]